MRPPLAVLLLAALIGLVGVASAGVAGPDAGEVVATPRFVPVAGPILVGDRGVAWVSRRDDAVLDLWVAEPGHGPRRVQRFSGSDAEHLRRPRLAASAGDVELTVDETRASGARRGRVVGVRSYRGAFGQALQPVAAEAAGGAATAATTTGRRVAVTRGCASAEIRVIAAADPQFARASAAAGTAAAMTAGPPAATTGATAPVATAGSLAARADRCPLRLRRSPRLRAGRLRLGLSCAGFPIGCAARVTVTARGRVIARGTARYNHSTPPFAAAGLRLGPRALRLLRARSRTRLRITARIGTPRALDGRLLDGTVIRTTRRVLVRRR